MIKKLKMTLLVFGVIAISSFSLSAFECESMNYPDGSAITFCDEYFVIHSTDLPGGGCAGPEYDCVGFFNYP